MEGISLNHYIGENLDIVEENKDSNNDNSNDVQLVEQNKNSTSINAHPVSSF